MAAPDARLYRLKAAVILFLLSSGLALYLGQSSAPWADSLGQASYDSLHRLTGQTWLTNSPVVVVYLDLASYQRHGLDPLKPWPRSLHAQLLDRLSQAGARAIIFDIVFSSAGPSAEGDAALAKAIGESGRVVLASEFNDTSHGTSDDQVRAFRHSTSLPLSVLAQAAATVGLAMQAIDDDYSVRRYVAGFNDAEPTLTWAAATFLHLPGTGSLMAANTAWLRYYGPPLSIPHVNYSEALEPADVPSQFFRDKIILIGARPWIEQFHERKDEFASPYHVESKALFLPGVEVHATEMLNLVRGDLLRRLDSWAERLLLLCVAALFGSGLIWLRPIPATFAALAGAALAALLACLAFGRGIWFPWLVVSAVEIPCAWAGSVLAHSVEWYRSRKRFEAAKRISDEKIREQAALIEKAHDAILVQDLGSRTLYANPSAERLYGWSAAALQDRTHSADLFLPDAQAAEVARETALRQGEWNGELRQQSRDGRIVIVSSRWTLIRDEAGQPKALLMMSTDITDQKELEMQLLRTQRMNTIGSLAGGMAHDLNNALAPILMGVQLLRRKGGDGEARQLLDLMESSTHRGADMVRQVLLFARGRGSDFERVQPGTILRELEKLVRETFPKNIVVDSFLADDLSTLLANPTQLHQILLNLCVNARDAMPNGGKLTFVADNVELAAAEVVAIKNGRPGKFVCLSVSDTGTGMPPEVQAKIFEPFFTTKSEGQGTGIGLATVLRIVTAHAGFLKVESREGQGTTFEVFLPSIPETLVSPEKPPRTAARGNGELILLADDEQAIRDLLKAELTSSGYRVIAACNGEEALGLFRQYVREIRVFITDGAMPIMDGATAVAAMRHSSPQLPVILTSGEAQPEKFTNVSFVPKPFAFDDILIAIRDCLAPGRAGHD